MTENSKHRSIRIDLNQFKLHIDLKKRIELTLHFDSPSRRFYLSVIAFVINEMKRLGKITSIPLEGNHDLMVLLNDTVGGSAGSSEKENLLSRIYRKWKNSLPNLEEAPLFKVIGRQKKYDEGAGKTYHFTEAEKDNWANLFEYIGSEKNVRLKFALDKIGAGLDDVDIIYEESINGDAWDRFLSSLKKKVEEISEAKAIQPISEVPEPPASLQREPGAISLSRYRWMALVATVVMIVGAGIWVIWELSSKPALLETASMDRKAFPLPANPSIAVLPFINMSDDKSQEFFSDGLTEEIITALSKSPKLFVIARNSSFVYKGKRADVQQVSRELGVKYLLQGSVRRSGKQLRITAQLIDGHTGNHLWAERYDRETKDIFAIQDEITMKIVTSFLQLTESEMWHMRGRHPSNLQAYLKLLEGMRYWNESKYSDSLRSFEQSLISDPHFAATYAWIAWAHMMGVWFGPSATRGQSLDKAFQFAEKAKALDDKSPIAIAALGHAYLLKREYDKALAEGQLATKLTPNSASAATHLGWTLRSVGRYEEAMKEYERALRLDPLNSYTLAQVGTTYFMMRRFEESISACKKALERKPRAIAAHLTLAMAYSSLDKVEETHAAASDVLKIDPNFSVEHFAKAMPFKNEADRDFMAGTLRKAGLK